MTTTVSAWDELRQAVQTDVLAAAAGHFASLSWNSGQIHAAQRQGLARLLAYAAEHSPFHARRLRGIDIGEVGPEDMSALPVMTKADMMDALDEVFTDRRLRRADVESALARTRAQPVPILGRLHRTCLRRLFRSARRLRAGPAGARVVCDRHGASAGIRIRAAAAGGHRSCDGGRAFGGSCHRVGDSDNDRRQFVWTLSLCARNTAAGCDSRRTQCGPACHPERVRLDAGPAGPRGARRPASDPSRPGLLDAAKRCCRRCDPSSSEAFGAPVFDGFGSTEGLVGKTGADDDIFAFNTDMCVVELVDSENRPTPVGVPAAKVLVTNLYNLVQPLIRYEFTDRFVRVPDAPGHGHLQARVQGRNDEILHYRDGTAVHPIVIRSVIVGTPAIIDYQVMQTSNGIDITAVATADFAVDELVSRLARSLADAGLESPRVTARAVDRLDRHPVSGKFRRFVPL